MATHPSSPDLEQTDLIPATAKQTARELATAFRPRIAGIMDSLTARAGDKAARFGGFLLAGYGRETAANLAGLSPTHMRTMLRTMPDVADLLAECESMGFSVYEAELHRRALAGADDRNSARLLEVVLKARRAEYREKQQVQIDVVHRADSAVSSAIGGWNDEPAPDSSDP